jgi:transcription elongation factor Elf1
MSGSFSLDNEKIKVPCPSCGKGIEVTIGQAKRSPNVTCRSCGKSVKLEASQLKKQIDTVEKSVRDLQRKLGNLFKK